MARLSSFRIDAKKELQLEKVRPSQKGAGVPRLCRRLADDAFDIGVLIHLAQVLPRGPSWRKVVDLSIR